MIVLIQNNQTFEVERISAPDLSLGVHDGWSMVAYTDEAGEYQTRIVMADEFYITCL